MVVRVGLMRKAVGIRTDFKKRSNVKESGANETER